MAEKFSSKRILVCFVFKNAFLHELVFSLHVEARKWESNFRGRKSSEPHCCFFDQMVDAKSADVESGG